MIFMERKTIYKLAGALAALVIIGAFADGITSGKDLMYHLQNRGDLGPLARSDIA